MAWGAIAAAIIGGVIANQSQDDEANVTQHSRLTPEQQDALNRLLTDLEVDMESPVQGFSGDLNIDRDPITQMIMDQITGNAEGPLSASQGAIMDALEGGVDEQVFNTTVKDPLLDIFNEEVLPGVDRRFAGGGFYGSDRNKSIEESTEDVMRTLTAERGRMIDRSKDRQLEAAGLAGDFGRFFTDVGSLDRSRQEGNMVRNYNEFIRQRNARSDQIANLLAAIGVGATENIATVSRGSPYMQQAGAQLMASGLDSWFKSQREQNQNSQNSNSSGG